MLTSASHTQVEAAPEPAATRAATVLELLQDTFLQEYKLSATVSPTPGGGGGPEVRGVAILPSGWVATAANDNVVHFGKGQTETELELEPGTHTLQLLLGDHMHVPHEPPVMSEKITITVE